MFYTATILHLHLNLFPFYTAKPFRVFSVFRGSNHNTLSPRGVCSRIPHPRHFRRDSHGLFIAHVYLLHIIPLSPSTRSTCSTRLSSSHFVYLVYFVVQISASFAFFAAKTFYTIYTAIKFIQHSIVTLWHSIHRSFCCLAAPPCQPLPSGR